MAAGGEVGRIRLGVSDNGPGIGADIAEQVFDPFMASKAEGMGLGLPISRGIIEAHHGGLSAHNREGGGAVFSFTLPVDQAYSPWAAAASQMPATEALSHG